MYWKKASLLRNFETLTEVVANAHCITYYIDETYKEN